MAITSTSIDLSWTASTDNVAVSHYLVFINSGSGWDAGTNVGNVTTYTYGGLTASTQYSFRQQAVDTAPNPGPNISGFTNIVVASTLAP